MKPRRLLQTIFGLVFGFMTLSALALAIANWHRTGPAGLIMVIVPLILGTVAVGSFEIRNRSMMKSGARIRTNIAEIARSVFDVPAAVREGYDMTVTAGAAGTLMAGFENDIGFTTDGTFRGARVSVASHASVLGRQIGEFHHTYSHVLVDVLGLDIPFSIKRERAGMKLALAIGAAKDAEVGDEAFDEQFLVQTDEAFAREVLDPTIRRRLVELQSMVSRVSSDLGPGGMTMLLTNQGLALRWPGDIDPALARFIRDLLLDMRERMLAYQNRRAVQATGAATGYRVATDELIAEESVPDAAGSARQAR